MERAHLTTQQVRPNALRVSSAPTDACTYLLTDCVTARAESRSESTASIRHSHRCSFASFGHSIDANVVAAPPAPLPPPPTLLLLLMCAAADPRLWEKPFTGAAAGCKQQRN